MITREIIEQNKKKENVVQQIKEKKQVQIIGISMLPFLNSNKIKTLFIVECPSYKIGDIVILKYKKSIVGIAVHRLVAYKNEKVVTKGDNNYLCDDAINEYDLLGKVEKAMLVDGRIIQIPSSRFVAMLSKCEGVICRKVSSLLTKVLHKVCIGIYYLYAVLRRWKYGYILEKDM